MKKFHLYAIFILSALVHLSYAQPPNIYILIEDIDGTDKSFQYIIGYTQIDIYSLEVKDSGGYKSNYRAFKIKHISSAKINASKYQMIAAAIDSSLNLDEGNPYSSMGGYHWAIKIIGDRDEVLVKRHTNSGKEDLFLLTDSILSNFNLFERKKFRRIYLKNLRGE